MSKKGKEIEASEESQELDEEQLEAVSGGGLAHSTADEPTTGLKLSDTDVESDLTKFESDTEKIVAFCD